MSKHGKFWLKTYDKHVPETLEGQYPTEDLGTILVKAMKHYQDRIGFYFMDQEFTYRSP